MTESLLSIFVISLESIRMSSVSDLFFCAVCSIMLIIFIYMWYDSRPIIVLNHSVCSNKLEPANPT